jgi:hypothetical protein
VAESLTASRFSALKGLQIVTLGKRALRPPTRVGIDIKFAPLPAVQSRLLKTHSRPRERKAATTTNSSLFTPTSLFIPIRGWGAGEGAGGG